MLEGLRRSRLAGNTCDCANHAILAMLSTIVACCGGIGERLVIPGTRITKAHSPTNLIPVASAFASSLILESWFPGALMSPANVIVHHAPPLCGAEKLLTLDSREVRTFTTHSTFAFTKTGDNQVGSPCGVSMNNPDRIHDVTFRLELTATKARAHSLPPATNQFAPTRYYTMPDEDVSKESLSSDDPRAGSSRCSQMLRSIRGGMRVVFACERGSAS
jgi:hypothetical protein